MRFTRTSPLFYFQWQRASVTQSHSSETFLGRAIHRLTAPTRHNSNRWVYQVLIKFHGASDRCLPPLITRVHSHRRRVSTTRVDPIKALETTCSTHVSTQRDIDEAMMTDEYWWKIDRTFVPETDALQLTNERPRLKALINHGGGKHLFCDKSLIAINRHSYIAFGRRAM